MLPRKHHSSVVVVGGCYVGVGPRCKCGQNGFCEKRWFITDSKTEKVVLNKWGISGGLKQTHVNEVSTRVAFWDVCLHWLLLCINLQPHLKYYIFLALCEHGLYLVLI